MSVVSVGFIEAESDATKCFRQMPQIYCPRPGAEVEIVQLVFKMLGMQWKVIDVEREFGILPDMGTQINSTNWSGMMGLLSEGKIAMSGLSLHVTPERMKSVLFAFPSRYFQTIYVVRQPNETVSQNFIMNAFPSIVWAIIAATFIIVWGMHIGYSLIFRPKTTSFQEVFFQESGTSLMQIISANLRQTLQMRSTGSLFLLNFLYVLAMIVILNYYQTAIFSNLVAPNYYKIPFRNRNELSAQLLEGKVFMTDIKRRRPYCAYQCSDLYKALEKNPMRIRNNDAEVFEDIAQNGVFQSKLDVNFIPNQLNWFSRRFDKIIIKDNMEVSHYTAFAFAKSQRKLRKKFDQALIKLLPAVEQITTAHGYRTLRRRFNPIQERHFFALSICDHFIQVFYLYVIGMAISVGIFLIEIFVNTKQYEKIAAFMYSRTE